MSEQLYTVKLNNLNTIEKELKSKALSELESGKVIYLPSYSYTPRENEQCLLSGLILNKKRKNISYEYQTRHLGGFVVENDLNISLSTMKQFMHNYAEYAYQLINTLLPKYSSAIQWGRTSYRPAEIKGRESSKRKDDTRLHVDSFPATPVNGLRILRVFCNINPHSQPRVWNLGEPFSQALAKFSPTMPAFNPLKAKLLKFIKATKTLRSPYDHYMMHLHDQMKLNDDYQEKVMKQTFAFPPYSTWIVFTDQTSHAALSGQFLLEQTFYLPVKAMGNQELSPLKQIEKEKLFTLGV